MAFFALEKLINLHDGYLKPFKVAGRELLLIQEAGRPYIIENSCPHMGVSLSSATLLPEGLIRCRAHGIEFELESGKAIGPLANNLECLKKFSIVYQGANLGVELA